MRNNPALAHYRYPVNNLYPTLQGEGVLAGTPMLLLRLQGCDVGCPFCDTKETWELNAYRPALEDVLTSDSTYTRSDSEQIADALEKRRGAIRWVLLTGGEPALYPLAPLVNTLHQHVFKVALETSGTATGCVGAAFDWVCVSPKINMPGEKLMQAPVLAMADELKMVIGKRKDIEKLDWLLDTYPLKKDCVICLQPMSQGRKATDICTQIVMQRGYRLSIQTHKYLSIP